MGKRLISIGVGVCLIFTGLNAQTWGKSKRLTWNSGDSKAAVPVVDSGGIIHVVWRDSSPGNSELYFKKSTNGGTTWVGSQRLTWSGDTSTSPAITLDSSDTIHVTWRDDSPGKGEIYYMKSTNGGTTWSAAKRLTWTSEYSNYPSIAVESSNNLHIVWADYTPGNWEIFHKKSTDGGVSWSGSTRLSWNPTESTGPDIAIDTSNHIHVVWYDRITGNYEILYRRSTDGGASWSGTNRLTWNSGNSVSPAIAVDMGDNIHMVWHDRSPGNYEIYYRRSMDGGASWSATKRLTWNPESSFSAEIDVDSNNKLHVVWYDGTPGNMEIYYKRSTNGGTLWDGSKRLTWNSEGSYSPAVAVDSGNAIHIVWNDLSPGNNEIYYKKGTQ
jgi:hypothetical protein